MLRMIGLTLIAVLASAHGATAQNEFDATGQLFLSFDLSGKRGKEAKPPRFGVKLGSSDMLFHSHDGKNDSAGVTLQFDPLDSDKLSVNGIKFNIDQDGGVFGALGDAIAGPSSYEYDENAFSNASSLSGSSVGSGTSGDGAAVPLDLNSGFQTDPSISTNSIGD